MSLHPKIQKLAMSIKDISDDNLLKPIILEKLLHAGASATEATMVLHLAYNINLEKAEEFVFNSNMFPISEINEVAYQSFEYLYYDRLESEP